MDKYWNKIVIDEAEVILRQTNCYIQMLSGRNGGRVTINMSDGYNVSPTFKTITELSYWVTENQYTLLHNIQMLDKEGK